MRNTISRKLAIPFALFLAPTAFLLYFLIDTHHRSIVTARNEIAGIPTITAALSTQSALLNSAGLAKPDRPTIQESIVRLREALSTWSSNPAIKAHSFELVSKLDEMLEKQSYSVVDLKEIFEALGKTIRLVGDASELILDPELDTFYYMDMLVMIAPEVVSAHREVLQDIAIVEAQKFFNPALVSTINQHSKTFQTLLARKHSAIEKTMVHARDVSLARPAIDASTRTLRVLRDFELRLRDTTDFAQSKTNLLGSMAQLESWQKMASDELVRLLNARITSFEEQRNRQILISALMFMAAVTALILLTRRHVTKPLTSLTGSMIGLADGDLTIAIPVVDPVGEIGDMARAVNVFKENALRNRILEAEKLESSQSLRLTAAALEKAEEIADLGHWRYDLSTMKLNCSSNLYGIGGFVSKEGIPKLARILARVPANERRALVKFLRNASQADAENTITSPYIHPANGNRYLELQIVMEMDAQDKVVAFMGIVQDVTENREHAQKLELRTQALAEAQALGRIGNWSYRIGEKKLDWSNEIFSLMRFDRSTFEPSYEAVMALYVDDGADLVKASQSDMIRTGTAQAVDVRGMRGDRTIGDFTVISKCDYNQKGEIIGFSGTIQDITARKQAERELEKLAYFDPLTGLANRALFQRTLARELDRSSINKTTGALLLLDLDGFKEVNDSLGHAAGDELLTLTAKHLRSLLPPNAFLARLGGDEFVVILANVDREETESIGNQIVRTIAQPIELRLGEVQIGTSIGIALFPEDGNKNEILMRNADLALYNAKENGRSCLRFFTESLSDFVREKSAIARDLRRALAVEDQLYVVYQPQVDIQNGKVTGFETLVRWRHPERGNIKPVTFIPVAESSSLIGDLGLYVLRASCHQMKAWIDAGYTGRDIAVNVSPAQIWQSDFEGDVKQILMESGLPPEYLTLEVTEGVFLREAEGRVRQALNGLKALGVKLALDDFGTGFSSLGYLNRLPFDKLKIDRRFVEGVHTNEERLKLLRGIIELGHGLGMTVVAEGAEHMDEVRTLRKLGCGIVQGYVFSQPLEGESALRIADILDLMVPGNMKQQKQERFAA